MNDTSSTDTDPDTSLWHVEASSGQVLVVTLEQLDEAFNDGLVNEQTRVWQEGMGCAVSLGELLGLDSDGAAEEPPAQIPQAASHAPSAYPPAPALVPQTYAQSAYPPARVTAAPQRVVVESATWPPVAAAPASRSVAPPASSPTSWQVNAAPSVIPTAFDILDDVPPPFAKPKRRGAALLALVALAAIGAGAAVFANGSGGDAEPTAAATPAPVVEPPKSHAIDVGNEPIHLRDVPPLEITKPDAPAVATTAKPSAAEAASLREAALRAANSKVSHARAKIASARPAHGGSKSGATGFKGTKSGSKYDPLNGAL